MNCPYCNHHETKVLETRETSDSETRRRRECLNCQKRFTTKELIERKPILVIKKDGKREEYSKDKIFKGVLRACEKRKITSDEINNLVESIESKIRSMDVDEIKSSKIGTLIMNKLKKLDKVAYIRFASVYRDFEDIKSFEDEILKVTKNMRNNE